MRVLLVSKFLHHVGGVETYLAWQAKALTEAGHEVGVLGMQPPPGEEPLDLGGARIWQTPLREYGEGKSNRVRSAATSIYSTVAGRAMDTALDEFRPDIVHYHGTCYQLTPAVVRAATKRGVPRFMTAHDYKLICVNQTLFDDKQDTICTDCVAASPGRALLAPVRRACMKGSRAVSAIGAVEGLVSTRVWQDASPTIVTPSEFMRSLLAHDGWDAERVVHLDLPWPKPKPVPERTRDSIFFLGRIFPEKGPHILLEAWASIADRYPDVQLRFAGDGSQRPELEQRVADARIPRTSFLGFVSQPVATEEFARAIVSAHPAIWYENSPYSVRESLLAGVPAAVGDHGGMPELVGPSSGYVVPGDSPADWAKVLDVALTERRAGTPELAAEVVARSVTETQHLDALLALYAQAR